MKATSLIIILADSTKWIILLLFGFFINKGYIIKTCMSKIAIYDYLTRSPIEFSGTYFWGNRDKNCCGSLLVASKM